MSEVQKRCCASQDVWCTCACTMQKAPEGADVLRCCTRTHSLLFLCGFEKEILVAMHSEDATLPPGSVKVEVNSTGYHTFPVNLYPISCSTGEGRTGGFKTQCVSTFPCTQLLGSQYHSAWNQVKYPIQQAASVQFRGRIQDWEVMSGFLVTSEDTLLHSHGVQVRFHLQSFTVPWYAQIFLRMGCYNNWIKSLSNGPRDPLDTKLNFCVQQIIIGLVLWEIRTNQLKKLLSLCLTVLDTRQLLPNWDI